MVVAKSGKTRALRIALGAVALAAAIAGVAGTASAHERDDGWQRGHEYGRFDRDHDEWRDGWRRPEWRHRGPAEYRPGWYGYGDRYRYAPPPAYFAPPPVYFPGSLNFGFVIR